MLAVEYGVREAVDPVAQDYDARCGVQHQIQFNVAVPVDEEIDIRVAFQIFFGVKHQRFLVFSHIVGFLPVYSFQATVLGPRQS